MVCTACGSQGPLEKHHVGRRKYSDVTTMLCVPCHVYCTIAGVYERSWRHNEPAIVRLWAGLIDIWHRFCECNSLPVPARNALNDAEYRGLFKYRPCSQVAEIREQVSPGTLTVQLRELGRLVREVTGYEYAA